MEIKMIAIDRLHPHPNNPREQLGDVTELAASIRKSGMMQNLTVIPAKGYKTGHYTVVIGHRRLKAAREIGLKTLPCSIVDIPYKEQLAMMLSENMQRQQLTLPEEVAGIQMMIDIGESVKDIADATGISETTIRRRRKLAELDPEEFRHAYNRAEQAKQQINLEDWIEITKIKDTKTKSELVSKVGTDDFKFNLNLAKEKEKTERQEEIVERSEEIAERSEDKMERLEGKQERSGKINSGYIPPWITVAVWDTIKEFMLTNDFKEKLPILVCKLTALRAAQEEMLIKFYDPKQNIYDLINKDPIRMLAIYIYCEVANMVRYSNEKNKLKAKYSYLEMIGYKLSTAEKELIS